MPNLKQIFRPLVIFYMLVIYVVACFSWWTWFHVNNLETILKITVEKEEIIYKQANLNPDEVINAPTYKDAYRDYLSKKYMILIEGLVFLIIILLATYQLHTGIRSEILLNRQQRNFLLSITHELKSPVASIRLGLETLLKRGTLDRDIQKKLLNNSLKDADRLQGLVENILMAAKIDNQSISLSNDDVDFSQLVAETVNKMKDAIAIGRVIEAYISPDIFIMGDRMTLSSIVINLIENALKYSPANLPIVVSLKAQNNKAVLKVADQGIGIDDKEKGKIFRKFYRVGNEDTRKTKGTGLGLYLVKQLTELHKGAIRISDNQPQGSVFTVTLPCEVVPEDDELLLLTDKTKEDPPIVSKNSNVLFNNNMN
ncbi:MAG: two-component sensor histidine kinase [Sphingobacteriales bacterium]|nr:MAG: two-component sensor histidine kinase [Sphingobacteriales bacterium]